MNIISKFFIATLLAFSVIGFSVHAQLITNDPSLPPNGVYHTPVLSYDIDDDGVPNIFIYNVSHFGFTNIVRTYPVEGELETFDSILTGDGPIALQGQVNVMIYGKGPPDIPGTYVTEMLSMDLTVPGAMIKESPTLSSMGVTTITPLGGGVYQINSFFDVFTELSLDGGQAWHPSVDSAHLVLGPLPEPGTYVLMGSFLVVGMVVAHRRKLASIRIVHNK